jgi:acyl carrier protein
VTDAEIREAVVQTLTRIAPETAGQPIERAVALRDQLDLDSMDLLNFVIALHERLGVDIPESDYARLATLDDITAYLSSKLAARGRAT